jgi:uncharacterized protein YdhG (YjbR/CyaY superfamily)
MARKRPTTIAEYIRSAPPAAQPHLRQVYAILKSVAPDAEEAIKWNVPFFVDPRFVFSFSAFKAHLVFAPSQKVLEHFRRELEGHETTKNYLKIPYDEPVPEKLIRKLAEYRVRNMGEGDSFW